MERKKANWELQEAITAARKTIKALEKFGKDLEPRLPAGITDGLRADLATLTGSKVVRPAFKKTAQAKTRSERAFAADGADLLSRLRYALKTCPGSTPEILKAVGVGSQVNPGKTTSVAAGLKAVIDASNAYIDVFRAAGVLESDLADAQAIMSGLLGADESQQDTEYTKKQLTEQKDAAQFRVERDVLQVASTGQIHFRKEAKKRFVFENLLPKSAVKKEKPAVSPKAAS
jgi:hypothetical protein